MSVWPIHDWQFWVVTLMAISAVGFVARRTIFRKRPRRPRRSRTRATLTIEGQPPRTRRSARP